MGLDFYRKHTVLVERVCAVLEAIIEGSTRAERRSIEDWYYALQLYDRVRLEA